jgi:CoA:oxalate CoA-transferase
VTNLGSKIDIAMLDCQVAILEDAIPAYDKTGEIPGPLGTRHPSIAPFQSFQAKDASIIIAAGNDHLFTLMTQALDRADLVADERFKTNELRHENIALLQKEMELTLGTKLVSEWIDALNEKGVPCAPINDIPHVIANPQVNARNMIIEVDDPVIGKVKTSGNPVKVVGAIDETSLRPSPELDADRIAILAEFMGIGK